MTHRSSHTGHALRELQNEQVFMADVADGNGFVEVPALKVGDSLVEVKLHKGANPPVLVDLANCVISEPQAGAYLDTDATQASADDTVTVGKYVFTFQAETFDDNYPVGSNRSSIEKVVLIGANVAASVANLAAAINDAFAKDPNGVTAVSDGVDRVTITAKQYGSAGEGIAVDESGWSGAPWQDLDDVAATETALATGAAAGFTNGTDDLVTGVDSNGVEVRWVVYRNEDPQDAGAKLSGNYAAGDTAYDTTTDNGNVGYGIGRMPPGWQP